MFKQTRYLLFAALLALPFFWYQHVSAGRGEIAYVSQLGSAEIELSSTDIILSNLTSGGDNGVKVELPTSTGGYSAAFSPSVALSDAGSNSFSVEFRDEDAAKMALFKTEIVALSSPTQSPHGTVHMTPLIYQALTNNESVSARFLLNGREIAVGEIPPNEPISVDIGQGWDCIYSEVLEEVVCDPTIIIVHCNPDMTDCIIWETDDSTPTWQVEFAAPVESQDSSGNAIRFDTIQLRSSNPSPQASTVVAKFVVTAAGLQSLKLEPRSGSAHGLATGKRMHAPIHSATLVLDGDGIVATGFDSTGDNGLLIEQTDDSASDGSVARSQFDLFVRKDQRETPTLDLNALDNQSRTLSHLHLELLRSDLNNIETTKMQISADFAPNQTAEVDLLLNGQLVSNQRLEDDDTALINIGHGWDCQTVSGPFGSGGFEICHPTVFVFFCNDDMTKCYSTESAEIDMGWMLAFNEVQDDVDASGNPIRYDEVRVYVKDQDRTASQPISQLEITASDLYSLAVTPDASNAPTAIALREASIFTNSPSPILILSLLTLTATAKLKRRRS